MVILINLLMKLGYLFLTSWLWHFNLMYELGGLVACLIGFLSIVCMAMTIYTDIGLKMTEPAITPYLFTHRGAITIVSFVLFFLLCLGIH